MHFNMPLTVYIPKLQYQYLVFVQFVSERSSEKHY